MAKDIVIKFKLDGVKDSVKDVISIQTAITKLKQDLATGLSTEGFRDARAALAALEAQYESLIGTVETANQDIKNSNDEMVSDTETSSKQAGDAVDDLASKHEDAAEKTKKANEKASDSAKSNATKTSESYKKAGDNIEKFTKGIVDAFAGVAIVFGANKDEADKFTKNFVEIIGVAHGVKGGIEAATSGFELLKGSFPAVYSGLQKIWAIMVANPIGAVIAGVAALTAGIYALTDGFAAFDDEQREAKRASDALNESYEKQSEELQKINDKIREQNDAHSKSLELQKKAELAESEQLSKKEELISLNSKYNESIIVQTLSNQQLVEAYKEIKDKQDEYNKTLITEQGAHLAFKKDAEDRVKTLKNQIASLDEVIKREKINGGLITGGPTIIGTEQSIKYNKTLAEREKLQEDLKWAIQHSDEASIHLKETQDNLNLGTIAYNKETLNTLNIIEKTIRARGLETEFDKIKAEEAKKAADAKKKEAEEYKNNIKTQYEELQKFHEVQILKTEEGTDARIVAEDKAYFAQLDFMEKHKKALELTENDIALFKQKHYNEDREREKKAYEESIKLDKETAEEKKRILNEQAANEKVAINLTIDALKAKKKAALEGGSREEYLKASHDLYIAELNEIKRASNEEILVLKDKYAKGEMTAEDYAAAVKAILSKLNQDTATLNEQSLQSNKEYWKKWADDASKALGKFQTAFNQAASVVTGIWGAILDLQKAKMDNKLAEMETSNQEFLDNLEAQRQDDLAKADAANQQELANTQAYYAQQLENDSLTAEERAKLQEAAQAREAQIKINGENAKIAIENDAKQKTYDAQLQLYNESEKLKEKGFEDDKKFKIAQVIISTITGAVAAFTGMVSAFPGPWGIAAGAIAAAGVAAMGAIQVSAIQAQKYQKGQAPSKPNFQQPKINVGGGATSTTASNAPTTKDNTLFSTAGGGLPQKPSDSKPQTVKLEQDEPIRAYVVASDITEAQEKEAALKRKVTGF